MYYGSSYNIALGFYIHELTAKMVQFLYIILIYVICLAYLAVTAWHFYSWDTPICDYVACLTNNVLWIFLLCLNAWVGKLQCIVGPTWAVN